MMTTENNTGFKKTESTETVCCLKVHMSCACF